MLKEKIKEIEETSSIFAFRYLGPLPFKKYGTDHDIKVALERRYGWVVPVETIKAFR